MGRRPKAAKVLPAPPAKFNVKIPKPDLSPEVARYVATMGDHPYPFARHMPEIPLLYDPVKEIGANVAQVILQIFAGIIFGFVIAHYLHNMGY